MREAARDLMHKKRDEAKKAQETVETLQLALMIYIKIGFKARTCRDIRTWAKLLDIDIPSHVVANAEAEGA